MRIGTLDRIRALGDRSDYRLMENLNFGYSCSNVVCCWSKAKISKRSSLR